MAKYCGYCGAALPDHAKVCGMCGRPLVDAEGPATLSHQETAGQSSPESQTSDHDSFENQAKARQETEVEPNEQASDPAGQAGKPRSRTASKAACALLALVLVGAAAVFALKSFGGAGTPEEQTDVPAGESKDETQQSQPVHAASPSDGKEPGTPGSAWDGTVRTERQSLGQEYTLSYRGCCRKEDGGPSGYTCFERIDGLPVALGRVWADFNGDGITDELEVLLESSEIPDSVRQEAGIPDGFGSLCLSFAGIILASARNSKLAASLISPCYMPGTGSHWFTVKTAAPAWRMTNFTPYRSRLRLTMIACRFLPSIRIKQIWTTA